MKIHRPMWFVLLLASIALFSGAQELPKKPVPVPCLEIGARTVGVTRAEAEGASEVKQATGFQLRGFEGKVHREGEEAAPLALSLAATVDGLLEVELLNVSDDLVFVEKVELSCCGEDFHSDHTRGALELDFLARATLFTIHPGGLDGKELSLTVHLEGGSSIRWIVRISHGGCSEESGPQE